jgi:hypothetical protein
MRLLHESATSSGVGVNSGPAVTALWSWSGPGSFNVIVTRAHRINDANLRLDVLRLHPNQLSEAGAIMYNLCAMDMILATACLSPSRYLRKFRLRSSDQSQLK